MRTWLNQSTMSNVPFFFLLPPPPPPFFFFFFFFYRKLTREFASAKANRIEKYGEGLKKKKNLNGPGKRKLGQETNYGTD